MRLFITCCTIILNSAIALGQFAEFSFKNRIHKFDPALEGVQLECTYEFTNTGEAPLIITSYDVECTCTRVVIPDGPVMPGEEGKVVVYFDSKGKTGWQYRKVLLRANTKRGVEEIEFRVKILS